MLSQACSRPVSASSHAKPVQEAAAAPAQSCEGRRLAQSATERGKVPREKSERGEKDKIVDPLLSTPAMTSTHFNPPILTSYICNINVEIMQQKVLLTEKI